MTNRITQLHNSCVSRLQAASRAARIGDIDRMRLLLQVRFRRIMVLGYAKMSAGVPL